MQCQFACIPNECIDHLTSRIVQCSLAPLHFRFESSYDIHSVIMISCFSVWLEFTRALFFYYLSSPPAISLSDCAQRMGKEVEFSRKIGQFACEWVVGWVRFWFLVEQSGSTTAATREISGILASTQANANIGQPCACRLSTQHNTARRTLFRHRSAFVKRIS